MAFEDIRTQGDRALAFLLSEAAGARSRDNITVASGAGVLPAGMVLGQVTASEKYVACNPTNSDGSEVAVAVLGYGVDATSADVEIMGITSDAEVKLPMLRFDASINTPAEQDTAIAELAAVGIKAR